MFETLKWIRFKVLNWIGIDVNAKSYEETLQSGQIRLLELLPGSGSDRICCKLKNVSLDAVKMDDFVALSWVWGPNTKHHIIHVTSNGQTKNEHWISHNLYTILSALRQSDQSQTFWVDAICINQSNKKEKLKQLKFMANIYTRATEVLVWLREASDESAFVVDCIRRQEIEQYQTARFLKGMVQVMLRPWFSRTWVVQEFALNKNSPVLCVGADHRVTWDKFYEAFEITGLLDATRQWADTCQADAIHGSEALQLILHWFFSSKPPNVSSFRSSLAAMRNRYQKWTGDQERDLSRALMALQSLQVTEPKDKIYGGLGLVNKYYQDGLETFCPLEEDPTLEQLHLGVTAYLLKFEKILLYAHFRVIQDKQPRRPSWVLDFSTPRGIPLLADTGTRQAEVSEVDISDDYRTLTVEGVFVDSIEHLIGPLMVSHRIIPSEFPRFLYPAAWIGQFRLVLYRLMMRKFDDGFTYDKLKELVHKSSLADSVLGMLSKIERLLDNTRRKLDSGLPEDVWKTLLATTSSDAPFKDAEETFQRLYNELVQMPPDMSLLNLNKFEGPLFANIALTLYGRVFFAGNKGYYGIAEKTIKKGDQLVLLFPPKYCSFIVRPKGGFFQLVGVAYIPPKDRDDAEKKQRTKFAFM